MIIEQLELLCIRNNEKISNVLKKIGVSPSNAQRWRNGEKMNTETLIKLADYFEVTTDYLLGREKLKANEINNSNVANSSGTNTINIHKNEDVSGLELEILQEVKKLTKPKQIELLSKLLEDNFNRKEH